MSLFKGRKTSGPLERLFAAAEKRGIKKLNFLPALIMAVVGIAFTFVIGDIPTEVSQIYSGPIQKSSVSETGEMAYEETTCHAPESELPAVSEEEESVVFCEPVEPESEECLSLIQSVAVNLSAVSKGLSAPAPLQSAAPVTEPATEEPTGSISVVEAYYRMSDIKSGSQPVTETVPVTVPTTVPTTVPVTVPTTVPTTVPATEPSTAAEKPPTQTAAEAAAARTAALWNEPVASYNRKMYLPQYYYGAPALPKISGTPAKCNANGIPMSDMKMPASLTFDANGVPTNYLYYIDGKATAYYGGSGTATGQRVHQGCVAVDPRIIPYGTEMWITSSDGRYVYGYCRAEDTGGFIYYRNGALVDLYMNTYADCATWGWRGVRVYILPSTY